MNLDSIDKREIIADIIILCVLLFWGMSSGVITIIVTAVLSISYFIRRKINIVYSLLFFYPFYCIFKISSNGISLYNIVILAAVMSLFMVKNDRNIKISIQYRSKALMNLLLIFCAYLLAMGLFRGRVDVMTILLDLLVPLLLVVSVAQHGEDIDAEKLVYAYSIGIIVAGAVGAGWIPVKNLNAYVSVVHYNAMGVRLARFQGLTVNPNYFSLDVNLAIAGLLALPSIKKNEKRKISNIILILLLIVIGLLTISKSFIVCLLATIIIFAMMGIENGNFAKTLFLSVLLVSIFVASIYYSDNRYVTAIIGRLNTANSVEDLTSERTVVWMNYLTYLFQHPDYLLLGAGAGAGRLLNYGASHSFFIECFYFFGVFGCALFIAFLYSLLAQKKMKWIFVLPGIVFLIRGVAINIVLREAFATDLILIFAFIKYGSRFSGADELLKSKNG